MKTIFILYILVSTLLHAQVLISPIEAMQENFSSTATISKKNTLLNKKRFTNVQQNAQVKLDTKIYRIYTAKKNDTVLGYGVLINRKVRSKNAVVLYFIAKNRLQGIEIIAFNEPHEYLPSKKWTAQFVNIATDTNLRLGREIPSISGATLSARSITDGSRLAFALYNELLLGK